MMMKVARITSSMLPRVIQMRKRPLKMQKKVKMMMHKLSQLSESLYLFRITSSEDHLTGSFVKTHAQRD